MKMLLCLILALAFASTTSARPVVIEEVATLTPPEGWEGFGRYGVAIDGNAALVSGERFVEDPASASGFRHEGAVFVYRRSTTGWNYAGLLGPIAPITQWTEVGLAMQGGIAVTHIDRTRIFERGDNAWIEQPLATGVTAVTTGPDIEIDGGRVLLRRAGCRLGGLVLRKTSGFWMPEGDLSGNNAYNCVSGALPLDLHKGRAIIFNREHPFGLDPNRALVFGVNSSGSWWQFAELPGQFSDVAINRPYLAATHGQAPVPGTRLWYETQDGSYYAQSRFPLQAADAYAVVLPLQSPALEHMGPNLFAQRNYSYDRDAQVFNIFRANADALRTNTHVATLQTRNGASLGTLYDFYGNRVIVSGWAKGAGDDTVRIYELPASLVAPPVQVHDFQSPSSGAAWQPTAGSTFTIATSGYTRVYRQARTSGLSASFLPAVMSNQAIQAEATITSVDGNDRWAGLVTRRTDDANYYYVTLRASGAVELRRMVNGVFTTLAAENLPVPVGRKFRLRLESIASTHRVYLDDQPLLVARDSTLPSGTAGVMAYRAGADYDNVILSPAPFTTIYDTPSFMNELDIDIWEPGIQRVSGGITLSSTTGIANTRIGALTEDQIVQTRVRPTSFVEPDNWVGLMARYHDDRNYLYVSLRGRGVISLWRRTNGAITQLATQRYPVTVGQTYTLRLEVVNNLTRVFVNDQLILSSAADPGPSYPGQTDQKSRVGLIVNRATAVYENFLAYQP
jgi:hypothetical protein